MATDFGKRLASSRKLAGFTQKQLAPLVGMSQSNLSELETVSFESGKTAQLARHCGVDAYWLATGDGDMLSGVVALPAQPPPAVLDLAHALPVVLGALAGLTAGQWRMVRARLDDLPEQPAAAHAVLADVAPLLGLAAPTPAAAQGDAQQDFSRGKKSA